MKRLLVMFAVCIALMGVISLPVSAESAASGVELFCNVNSEGDCLVNMTVTLRLEGAETGLVYPLPVNATGITMNGASVATRKTDSAIEADISRVTQGMIGEIPLTFNYTIPEAVGVVVDVNGERKLKLDIPLLSGFKYPVEKLDYTITMPAGELISVPSLTSIYRQNSAASDMPYIIKGNQIIGSSKVTLNDHDAVTLSMIVSEEMFPTVSTYIREGNPEIIPMLVCAGLALLYWLIFLRALPLRRSRSVAPPEGITAGELGCRLTLAGADLTMMVFSWAQLGYILIYMDGNGRVLLHKRMDMGNERSQFEVKVFKLLFGNRRVVDGTGYQYARLCRKVAGMIPSQRTLCKPSSGNMKIFRALACGTQVFCGICVAMNMTAILALQILLSFILGVLGAITAWLIQDVAFRHHLRGKVPVYIGFVCLLIWIVLGLLCGQVWIPLCSSLGQLLLGYFAAYGGRRSDVGRLNAGQVLGLRRYLKKLPKEEISRLMKNDPDYFFNMAPYALAMGVINPYAKAFGRRNLDQCPYLMTRVHGKRTAEEWGHLMADAADMMDAKARQMQIEKWTAVQIRFGR